MTLRPTQRGASITFDGVAGQELQVWIEDVCTTVNGLSIDNSAVWGFITGDVTDQTDLITYLTTNYFPIDGLVWGDINGTITDQDDLVSFIGDIHTVATTVSTDTTITADRAQLNVDASGGDVTITLPALGVDKFYTIRKINSTGGNVIITGSDNINGSTSATIYNQYTSADIAYCGTEWGII